ncbi:MAG: hypothetical protein WA960_17380 [Tunicatimonas sp.]
MSQNVRVRWWLIFLLPLLAAQFYFARRVSEPYPAIMFPPFTSVPIYQGYPYDYEYLQVTGYTATDSILLTLDELLGPVPFKAKVFYPHMVNKIKEVTSSCRNNHLSPNELALAHYLQYNLRVNTGSTFERLKFRWYLYRADSPYKARPLHQLNTRLISLNAM